MYLSSRKSSTSDDAFVVTGAVAALRHAVSFRHCCASTGHGSGAVDPGRPESIVVDSDGFPYGLCHDGL